ncbi:hypothetical protein BJF83_00980 [Nocardiopsis sp. CNR-923]|uniref:hypothetical protein n=1 Tax=Nocardiopsis sp. CNR-923 TaxID=1904965 RepID=UPI00095BCEB2|nr:hypothetical protein [Nocardiopsis sp. CNR-923]OLT28102.1 hypothetical protein BJF83_00980 [Nocardiopsis sp. CNR-923]
MDIAALADLIPWADLGLAGLVSLGVYLILTGRLVPRSTVEDLLQARDERLADYITANDDLKESGRLKDEQISELLEHSRTSVHVLQALRDVGTDSDRSEIDLPQSGEEPTP